MEQNYKTEPTHETYPNCKTYPTCKTDPNEKSYPTCKTDPNEKTYTQNTNLSLKKFTQEENDDLIQELQQYERENKDHIKWVLQQFSNDDSNCMEAKEAISHWNKYIFAKKKYDFMLKNPRYQPSIITTPFQNNNNPFSFSYM